MEDACDFSQDYTLETDAPEDGLMVHLKNCTVCQDEIRLVE